MANLRKKGFEKQVPLFLKLAEALTSPSQNRAEINLSRLNRYANDGETVVVPGKILSSGDLTKKLHVIAWAFSAAAATKIKKAGGTVGTIDQFVHSGKVTGVRLMK